MHLSRIIASAALAAPLLLGVTGHAFAAAPPEPTVGQVQALVPEGEYLACGNPTEDRNRFDGVQKIEVNFLNANNGVSSECKNVLLTCKFSDEPDAGASPSCRPLKHPWGMGGVPR